WCWPCWSWARWWGDGRNLLQPDIDPTRYIVAVVIHHHHVGIPQDAQLFQTHDLDASMLLGQSRQLRTKQLPASVHVDIAAEDDKRGRVIGTGFELRHACRLNSRNGAHEGPVFGSQPHGQWA